MFCHENFEQEEHARDLVNGTIFANLLSHFKKLEGDEARGDEYEGAMILQLEALILGLRADFTPSRKKWE